MKLLLPALALMLLAPAAAAAEIGRLFYTPEQRASLDTARSKRTRTTLETEATEAAPAPPPAAPEVVTYGGIVQRSDGKSTVWLNNRPLSGKQPADAPLVRRVRPDGTVTLHAPQSGRNVDLKVGQRAELLSGTVQEGYRREAVPKPEAATQAPAAVTKPAAEAAVSGSEADRRKDEREHQENLEDALRALRDAANARSAGTAPPPVAVPAPPLK